jgi:phage/plasmid-like protein (TIGR03299 family)
MAHNIQTMAYVGDVPWHGLGKAVTKGVHADELIVVAGLDWRVVKRPARGAKPVRKPKGRPEVFARYEIVRVPREGSGENEVVLGIVSERYESLQNQDAFAFFDPIVDRKTAFFETAGAAGEGERVWVMAKMPDAIQVVRGDECQKYLLLSNTHTGQGSVIVKFTAVRVVCQNTLMLAMEDGQQAFRIRHSKIMSHRLAEIGELVAAANVVYEKAAELFRQMAKIQLSTDVRSRYLEAVFPMSEAQKKARQLPPKWQYVSKLLDEVPDLQMTAVRGTLWAAYNAITRFEDYRIVDGEAAGARLDRVWFGAGAGLKLKALTAAAEIVRLN